MSIIRRIAPAAALLTMIFMVSAPAAQSMILQESAIQQVKVSSKPLSTNTSPTKIRIIVKRAWFSGELRWHSQEQWYCFDQIIKHESAWNPWATNGMGWEETGGIPQAHPSHKMREAGKDYRTNVWTQVRWGLNYIRGAYGTPCHAWSRWQERAASGRYGWY